MTDHQAQDDPWPADLPLQELHLPHSGWGGRDPGASDQSWEGDLEAEDDGAAKPVGILPPPKGLSRRDRHEWRTLELARLQRETQATQQLSHQQRAGWSKGFIRNPPRGLGRRGRRAWLAAERDSTRSWWAARRASNQDIDARSVGVLVVVLLIGAGLMYVALFGRHTTPTATGPAAPSPATAVAPGIPAMLVTSPPAAVVPAATTAATTSSGSRAALTRAGDLPGAGLSGAHSGPQPLAGHWQPTPAGGVTPIGVPAPAPIDPAAVKLLPPATGPATAAQLSTPVGAVTAWLARTCPSRPGDPYGADVAAGRPVMTTAGWAAAAAALAADTAGPGLWKAAAAARQSRTCGDFDVQLSTDAPSSGGVAFVEYTAHRVVTTPGQGPRVEQLLGARMVIRQAGGRWLVDRAVIGG
jgi:hypothetical protein